jgi:Tfp pilus assembly protein PilF
MADAITLLKIFLASPGGLDAERRTFREQVEEWNNNIGEYHGVRFRVLSWEDVPPGTGRAQALINPLVEQSDYFVLLMHDRWGSAPGPTGAPVAPTSGTEEEFLIAERCRVDGSRPMRDIAPVFKAVPANQLADPGDLLKPVIEFKKRIQQKFSHLYAEFDELEPFRVITRRLLSSWGLPPRDGGAPGVASAAPAPAEGFTVPSPPVGVEISPAAAEAERLANEGKLVEAEIAFVSAIAGKADLDAINRFGHFLRRLGRLGQSQQMYERLLELAPDDTWKAAALGNLGLIELARGNLDAAEDYLKRSLAINEELGRKEGMAGSLGNLGLIEWTRGNLDVAEDYHRRSLAIDEELGHKVGIAATLGNLGVIEGTRRNLAAAEDYLKRSLAIEEALGRKEGMATALGNLGLIERTRGNLDLAEDYHRRSLAINEELGRKEGMATALGNLGLIERTRWNLDLAEDYHRRSLAINESLGHKEGMAIQLGNLGLIEETRGNLDAAEDYLKRSLAINEALGRKEGMAIQLGNLGLIERTRGNPAAAEDYHTRSLAINEALGSKEGMANQLGNLGAISEQRGEIARAREVWTRSRDLFREAQMPQMVERVQAWLDGLPAE